MSQINKLPGVGSLQASDSLALYSKAMGDDSTATLSTLLDWLNTQSLTDVEALDTRLDAAEATLSGITTELNVNRTFTGTGVSSAFSTAAKSRLRFTLTADAGVVSALVQVESADGLTVFGSIDYPNGSPSWVEFSPGDVSIVERCKSFVGSGTLTVNARG